MALKRDQSITTLALLILVISGWSLLNHKRSTAVAIDSDCNSQFAKLEESDFDPEILHHSWIEVRDASYPLEPPTPDKVEEWKVFFSLIEDQEPPSNYYLKTCYKTPEQYLAVQDLMEVWLSQEPDSREDITLWRLLQMDTTATYLLVSGKVYHIRDQIDSLLDYNTGINFEMNSRSILRECLYGFYDDLVLKCILHTVPSSVGTALIKEQEAWLAYHNSAMKTFEAVNDPSGSAFPQWLYNFGAEDHKLRRLSQEDLLYFLYPVDVTITFDRDILSMISDKQITVEYQELAKGLVDLSEVGLGATIKEQYAILQEEQNAWSKWMTSRKKVSSLLPDNFREVYDYSTFLVRREKMQQMKNRKMYL